MGTRTDELVKLKLTEIERVIKQLVQPKSRPRLLILPSGGILAKTPGGGIAARTGSGPWTPGVATCTLCEQYDDSGTWKIREISPTEDVVIYNSSTSAIAASKPIQAKPIGGKYYADVAECA